jgi:hypothetical protein
MNAPCCVKYRISSAHNSTVGLTLNCFTLLEDNKLDEYLKM